MEDALKVTFYVRAGRKNAEGLIPLFMRVTINGTRFDTSVRHIDPAVWKMKSGKLTGKSPSAQELNDFMEVLKAKVYSIQKKFIRLEEPLTLDEFEREWSGEKKQVPMLIETFKEHNLKLKQLVGIDYAVATKKKYETTLRHTEAFLNQAFRSSDVPFARIKYQHVVDFAFWLKTKKKCNHNSTIKYLTNFKKIINIAIKNEWISKSPFVGYKMVQEESERRYLTADELRRVAEKEFSIERITQVRDMFLFSCYTGLAYADIKKLSKKELDYRPDGRVWVITKRQKTKNESRVPLLPPAIALLNKYSDHPECCGTATVLPVLSNQKMNSYLKEIGDICGIEKLLTTHVARHTFATTVTLNKGVPLESVSKMLGHKNIKETQRYAKILDEKIDADMNKIAAEFPATSGKDAKVRKMYSPTSP